MAFHCCSCTNVGYERANYESASANERKQADDKTYPSPGRLAFVPHTGQDKQYAEYDLHTAQYADGYARDSQTANRDYAPQGDYNKPQQKDNNSANRKQNSWCFHDKFFNFVAFKAEKYPKSHLLYTAG
jgi:hypothetical protein